MRRLFGTNGIRGIFGEDMTPELALGIGRAAGTFFNGVIAIGRDTRTSSGILNNAIMSALASTGCDVIDLGIVPTPSLQYFVKTSKLKGGVMITASHNPPEFNGIKCVDGFGMECSAEDEEAIEAIYFGKSFNGYRWNSLGRISKSGEANIRYIDSIVSNVDSEAIRRRKLKVVLDCGNGAGCLTSPFILKSLGCDLVTINAQPDGRFPGRPPEPLPSNVEQLRKIMKETKSDIGVAHDGDADRVIFVDETGEFVHGDKSLALLALEAAKKSGGLVVTPISSSNCVEEVVKSVQGEVRFTRVGSPIVARAMYSLGAIFGGEENGGLIFPEHQFCRDGGMAVAKMLELLVNRGKGLSILVSELPEYHLYKKSVNYPKRLKEKIMEMLMKRTIHLNVNTIDGLKILHDDGWVLIRPSGTESVIRIFAESKNPDRAEQLGNDGVSLVEEIVRNLQT